MSAKGKSKRKTSKSVSRSERAGLQFPVGRVARYLREGLYAKRVASGAPVFLAGAHARQMKRFICVVSCIGVLRCGSA